jgi:two-component system, cell cycle sensor histidine kinase and response regulator CckA
MQAGAADYLVKSQLHANALGRSVRYALTRKRAAAVAAFEQARLAAFGAEIGLALTRRDTLAAILERCSRAMVQYLNASLAQISTFDARTQSFETQASVGSAISSDQPSHAPQPRLDVASLSDGKSVLIRNVLNDSRFPNKELIQTAGWVSYAAYPLVLEDKLVGLMSIFANQSLSDQITLEMGSVAHGIALCIQRKRSEEALDVSEFKYRTVVESIKEVIFQLDEFGNWTFLNPAWTAVTGFDVKSSIGSFFLEYVYQDDREQNQKIFLNLLERKLDYCRHEIRVLTSSAKTRWVEAYMQPVLGSDGAVVGLSGSLTDITERKVAETQIQKLAAFPRVNPNPVLEFAADGSMSYANDAALEMAKSLGREHVLSILPPDAGTIAQEALVACETRMREEVHINGRTITWSFFPVPSSHVIHCYGADVTDMLNLESQLRHAQKLESVGQLAAGIAHDFNNILTVIQGYCDCLLQRNEGSEASRLALKQIGDATKRAAALTRQLLTFSRKQVIQLKVLDLNSVLGNLANMLPRLLGEHILLETNYSKEIPSVEADTGMLEQIVMNLAVNARDAMPKGGRLNISTSSVQVEPDYARKHPDARPGDFVCLTVADTGCGMDARTLERIFEPFFTTKEVGKGTGLGLATVYGIVKQHRGWIEVSSEVSQGTAFKVYFPGLDRELDPNTEFLPAVGTIQGGKETVLLVEDEPVLRELVHEILSGYQYRVIQAGTGIEALRLWDEYDGKVDLLLTDMVMPEGMNGSELAEQLKRRKPDLKVIFTSGYSSDAVGRDFNQEEAVFLPKPYLPPQLAQLVRRCLDTPSRKSHHAAESANATRELATAR